MKVASHSKHTYVPYIVLLLYMHMKVASHSKHTYVPSLSSTAIALLCYV
jgi:hypothetical protein